MESAMKNKLTLYLLLVLCVVTAQVHANEAKLLDFYDEEIRLFGVANAGEHINTSLDERKSGGYGIHGRNPTLGYSLDFVDKVNGDLSVKFSPGVKNAEKFGFVTTLWGNYFPLKDKNWTLKFQLKVEAENPPKFWKATLLDANGKAAIATLKDTDTQGKWKELALPLKSFSMENDFDVSQIELCEFEAGRFSKDAVLRFDMVRFEDGRAGIYGITDKSISQRMDEQKATKNTRIQHALKQAINNPKKEGNYAVDLPRCFAMMYANTNLEEANRLLVEELKRSEPSTYWSLARTPMFCRVYYNFSNRAGKFKGRMTPETEKLLLETLWERTKEKNDIHWARQGVWMIDGSENHGLNAMACNLVTSRIFMNEPEYKDRIYPDYGFGGSYHYGHAGYYGKGIDPKTRHGGGRANLSDGKKYKARDHYEEWLKYFKEYVSQRAKHGFFIENSSPGYTKHTLGFVFLVYAHSGDEELKRITGDFLTLFFADWAQTTAAGITGGPKTRHKSLPSPRTSAYAHANYLLGSGTEFGIWGYWRSINDFALPKVVQMMLLDREGMKHFVYQARGVGEETGEMPRPLGAERSFVINPNSRFLKYAYVSPYYTLGTQMDHPRAIHSHPSLANRWCGMTVTHDDASTIYPVSVTLEGDPKPQKGSFTDSLVVRSAQEKNALIVQNSRGFTQVNPEWFPAKTFLTAVRGNMGVYVGKNWDEKIEKNGWIFLRNANVYAGVRVAAEDPASYETNSGAGFHGPEDEGTVALMNTNTELYTWDEKHPVIILKDRYSPVILQAGDQKEFGSFEDFIDAVTKAPLALHKTVVRGWNVLVYTAPGEDSKEIVFNASNNEIPTIGGEYINYEHPMTFDSPYIKSKYDSGKITIEYDGQRLELDFSSYPLDADQAAFKQASDRNWQDVFFDPGTGDWTKLWFLDGEIASVENGENGMQLTAGPQYKNNGHHMVLWTKDSFEGDVKIEYEYTRLDFEKRAVNILYIQATGSGEAPYVKDITEWKELRSVPSMSIYYDHMNTYHISYAAAPGTADEYIRARRYMPSKTGLEGTDLEPDYYPKGLFEPGVPHKITVIKQERDLFMRIENPEQVYFCHMTNPDLPPVTEGRIGLRHMFTRSARYKNIRISIPVKR